MVIESASYRPRSLALKAEFNIFNMVIVNISLKEKTMGWAK